ncbi:uncharacterized protein LOC124553402 [Schistocerca americana]|uniref:uncharacterized protein LOC124553402 n=1 Tax=Schistocerca americana TaxID=7009 RepID=UPI001F503F9D|nr:uncharacterized protein LOC124553402 [Schistocerca americana]
MQDDFLTETVMPLDFHAESNDDQNTHSKEVTAELAAIPGYPNSKNDENSTLVEVRVTSTKIEAETPAQLPPVSLKAAVPETADTAPSAAAQSTEAVQTTGAAAVPTSAVAEKYTTSHGATSRRKKVPPSHLQDFLVTSMMKKKPPR